MRHLLGFNRRIGNKCEGFKMGVQVFLFLCSPRDVLLHPWLRNIHTHLLRLSERLRDLSRNITVFSASASIPIQNAGGDAIL